MSRDKIKKVKVNNLGCINCKYYVPAKLVNPFFNGLRHPFYIHEKRERCKNESISESKSSPYYLNGDSYILIGKPSVLNKHLNYKGFKAIDYKSKWKDSVEIYDKLNKDFLHIKQSNEYLKIWLVISVVVSFVILIIQYVHLNGWKI